MYCGISIDFILTQYICRSITFIHVICIAGETQHQQERQDKPAKGDNLDVNIIHRTVITVSTAGCVLHVHALSVLYIVCDIGIIELMYELLECSAP